MATNFRIPDELAERLRERGVPLDQVIEAGLRELGAGSGFTGVTSVLETLAGLPSPQAVLELRPAPELQTRIEALLEKSRDSELTPAEAAEWERYEYLEHLVRMAKAAAQAKLRVSSGNA